MVPSSLIPPLGAAAHSAVRPILGTGAIVHGQRKPSREEDYVAAVVLGGVPALVQAWIPILQPLGISLSVSGVFCHGHPQVRFTTTGTVTKGQVSEQCELADLLVVVDDLTAGSRLRQAVLVQAKRAKSASGVSLHGKELHQLDLYQNWPEFTFADAGYDSRRRAFGGNVTPPVTQASGSYGIIDTHATPPDWQEVPPAKSMPLAGIELGVFIASMADTTGKPGGRAATIGGQDDWSFTVDELLRVTAGKPLNLASVPAGPFRGATYFAPFGSALYGYGVALAYRWGEFWNVGGRDDGPPPGKVFFDPGQGLSSVHLVLHRE